MPALAVPAISRNCLRVFMLRLEQKTELPPSAFRLPSLPLDRDLRFAHRRSARPDAASTARLIPPSLSLPRRASSPLGDFARRELKDEYSGFENSLD